MGIGVGIVGAGIFGQRHAQAYALHPDARLIAVCDKRKERADKLAAAQGATAYYDIEAMLEHPGLQAVSIVTPDHLHAEPAIAAARRGMHLLVEKPLATSMDDCHAIITAAADNGVLLMVDFHNRWNPPFCAAHDAIRQGKIGRPMYAYMRLSNAVSVPTSMLDWAGGSSVVWFLGSHCLDLLRWLLDAEIEEVYATAGSGVLRGQNVDADDYVVSFLRFSGGITAVLENAWILPARGPVIKDFKCEIIGDQGAIYIDPSHNECLVTIDENGVSFPDLFAAPLVGGKLDGFVMKSIWHFVDCVRDSVTPAVTGSDGMRATEAGLAILRSAREGVPVKVGGT
jgi:predicted dehydrogenase